MRRFSLVGPLGALALLAGVASRSFACSCAPTDFYAAFALSHAVFRGEVLEISGPAPEFPDRISVTIRVDIAWKGTAAPSTIQVVTASSGAACGYSFRAGARYLVYANLRDGALWVSLCSRTHDTWPADPDLGLLNSPLPSMALTVSPNPSVRSVRLAWTIFGDPARQARARLDVLDSRGRRIRTLVNGPATPGPHESFWDGRDEHGRDAPRGIYWVRLAYGDRVASRRLVKLAAWP